MTNMYINTATPFNRGLMQPRRTVEQVEHRYQLMQELKGKIEDQKKYIEKQETLINRAEEEILKAQEILDNLSRGENIPGETY